MTIMTHTCRGNYRSAWFGQRRLRPHRRAPFRRLEVDGFFVEYDDERSGGFEPLRFVPKGRMVVLGLVTTKTAELEAQGRDQAPRRGGRAIRRHRPALPLAAVRVRVDGGGQRPHLRGAGREASAGRRDGRRNLGICGACGIRGGLTASTAVLGSLGGGTGVADGLPGRISPREGCRTRGRPRR